VHVIGEDEFCFFTFRSAFFTRARKSLYYYYGGRRHRVTHWPPPPPTYYTAIIRCATREAIITPILGRAFACFVNITGFVIVHIIPTVYFMMVRTTGVYLTLISRFTKCFYTVADVTSLCKAGLKLNFIQRWYKRAVLSATPPHRQRLIIHFNRTNKHNF